MLYDHDEKELTPERVNELKNLEKEVMHLLDIIPGAVRAHEGGGPENLAMSLAISVSKLMQKAKGK